MKETGNYLSVNGVLKYASEIIMGLKYLHSNKIIHRDLKPANIFITSDNVCVIGDFGLSKLVPDLNELMTSYKGSPLYMSPELLFGNKYDSSCDIWSLGCIIYELCTYMHPFQSNSKDDFMKLIRKPFASLNRRIPEHFPQEIYRIISDCLDYRPNKRPTINAIYENPLIQSFITKDFNNLIYAVDVCKDKDYDVLLYNYSLKLMDYFIN